MVNEYTAFFHGKVIAICEAIKSEKIGIIAGSRTLVSLHFELFDDKKDEDFLQFLAIDSETDHLPVDWERKNWSKEALERKDKEIEEYELFYKNAVFSACDKLVQRFSIKKY